MFLVSGFSFVAWFYSCKSNIYTKIWILSSRCWNMLQHKIKIKWMIFFKKRKLFHLNYYSITISVSSKSNADNGRKSGKQKMGFLWKIVFFCYLIWKFFLHLKWIFFVLFFSLRTDKRWKSLNFLPLFFFIFKFFFFFVTVSVCLVFKFSIKKSTMNARIFPIYWSGKMSGANFCFFMRFHGFFVA